MINHFRTLLLNKSGQDIPAMTFPGEEFVPPLFRPRTLPKHLESIHRVFFNQSNDRAFFNFRLCQILTFLHNSELEEFVTNLDSRITYLPLDNRDLFDNLLELPQITTIAGTNNLIIVGLTKTPVMVDRLRFKWQITVIDNDDVKIDYYDENANLLTSITSSYVITNGMSDIINVPGNYFQIRFPEGIGSAWIVNLFGKPLSTLTDLIISYESLLSEELKNKLFGTEPTEPYITFRNLWEQHNQPMYRLSGIILALAYRINELER